MKIACNHYNILGLRSMTRAKGFSGVIKNRLFLLLFLLSSLPSFSALASTIAPSDSAGRGFSYVPRIHGVVRPRFELLTGSGEHVFQIRYARVSLEGNIARNVNYFLNVDFCDRGVVKPLDFWVKAGIIDGLSVKAGQFRMPFGIDMHRAPNAAYFSDRSFIASKICNYRALGLAGNYAIPSTPLSVEAGVFGANPISEQGVWSKRWAASVKALCKIDNVTLTTGFITVSPRGARGNMIDGAIFWENSRWHIEGEYVFEKYPGKDLKPTHGWNLFADYRFPLKSKFFNRMSLQARFDGMSAHSSLSKDENGKVSLDHPERKRITAGATISHLASKYLFFDVRLNYEKYFYESGAKILKGEEDKILTELIIRF